MTTAAASVNPERVALVIAAYNEGSVIAEVVRDALRLFPLIIAVDDGSPDGTGAAALSAGAVVLGIRSV